MPDFQEIEFLVLRKIPYGEHALIVKGLSPEQGQCGFVAYGAAAEKRRAFPELEQFRLLRVVYEETGRELHRLKSAEILEDFCGLSHWYDRFQSACWIAQFSLLNVMCGLPHSFYMNAVEVALRRLAGEESFPLDGILTGVTAAFLFEEGWLAPMLENRPEVAGQLRQILEMASGKEFPPITDESWKEQFSWCKDILLLNECRLP